MSLRKFFGRVLVLVVVSKCAVSISNNKNNLQDYMEALLNLSGQAIQGRQNPQYHQFYKPQIHQYGYPLNSVYQYPRPTYPERPPEFFKKTKESVMDALFSIAQNDDLQCVPKLVCEATTGGLTGRQGGFNLPLNVDLESLTGFLSSLNSVNMSPVLHFGKAAVLGFTSKGNSRSCIAAYPQCPNDPDKLIQYLNNHNGGFFRFFQGIRPSAANYYQQLYGHHFRGYKPPNYPQQYYEHQYFGKSVKAEERIQNRPSEFLNSNFERGYKSLSFPQDSYTTPQPLNIYVLHTDISNALKFPPQDAPVPYRSGKKFHFNTYTENDLERPLPNHVPSPNIFPDRTGTGELRLDNDDVENNYKQSLAYDSAAQYNKLLYESFPTNANQKNYRLKFPKE